MEFFDTQGNVVLSNEAKSFRARDGAITPQSKRGNIKKMVGVSDHFLMYFTV